MQTITSESKGMVVVTRPPSPSIAACELTYMSRTKIDFEKLAEQHAAYMNVLRYLGLTVVSLPAQPALADAVFVEDTAVVLDEIALISSPCRSRKPELASVHPVLESYRKVIFMPSSDQLEGGDVIRNGNTIYVGQSTRTNNHGLETLRAVAGPLGYTVIGVPILHCLHLSTAASYLGDDTFLVNPRWIDKAVFAGYRVIEVAEDEPWAANVLSVAGTVITPAGFPRTRQLMTQAGFNVRAVDLSELLKAEAGVTCMGLLFPAEPETKNFLEEETEADAELLPQLQD